MVSFAGRRKLVLEAWGFVVKRTWLSSQLFIRQDLAQIHGLLHARDMEVGKQVMVMFALSGKGISRERLCSHESNCGGTLM